MATQITVEGRLVQGGVVLKPAKDMKTGQQKIGSDGKGIEECFMSIAVPKNSPHVATYYAAFDGEARANFPHLFPNGGACTHPRFAMKWQDGDGVDSNGKSVAGNEGFAGHWIIKCNTRYAPNCYERNAHGQLVQLTEPEKIIKRGYNVAVGLHITGNGVEPGNPQAVPGLFVSPNLVLFVSPGQEIISGPDPSAAFANVQGAVPASAVPPSNLAAPALPGAAALPLPAAVPAALPAMPGAALLPPPPAVKQYIMQPSAQGATREALHANGWTDDQLVAAGHLVIHG